MATTTTTTTTSERIEKIKSLAEKSNSEAMKLIYEWTKMDVINFKEFKILMFEINRLGC